MDFEPLSFDRAGDSLRVSSHDRQSRGNHFGSKFPSGQARVDHPTQMPVPRNDSLVFVLSQRNWIVSTIRRQQTRHFGATLLMLSRLALALL
jgi:hypothetical protein